MLMDNDDELIAKIISNLNSKQIKAVTAPFNKRLQIIAGPGTGKTKVITSRVAYLILHEGISPQHIIVTTFTRKAANEMVERLGHLLEGSNVDISKLLIGTFHGICYRIIKRYGGKMGISAFTIADEKDCSTILQEVVSGFSSQELEFINNLPDVEFFKGKSDDEKTQGFNYKAIKRQISKLKSSTITTESYSDTPFKNKFLALVYQKYQEKLNLNMLLDYDDCLLKCYELVSKFPVLNFVEHLLVDEFQDTNGLQLQLMYQFSKGHPSNSDLQNNVTVVGDPDQSIYMFRDAQAKNFEMMRHHYDVIQAGCDIVTLDENYRSTNNILELSEAVMRQQSDRIKKTLSTSLPYSFPPVYQNLKSSEEEAKWMVYEMEHLINMPLSIFKYSDFSILVRSSYQTRVIENELVRSNIPYEVVKGKAFWDRKEVQAILSYLKVVANGNDRLAILNTVNLPKRGIGQKTLEAIERLMELSMIENRDESLFEVLTNNVNSKSLNLTTKAKGHLIEYIEFIQTAKQLSANFDTEYQTKSGFGGNEEKLRVLFNHIYERSGLKKLFGVDASLELNIMEVARQLYDFTPQEENLPLYFGGDVSDLEEDSRGFLSKFVQSIGLSDIAFNGDNKRNCDPTEYGKVSISTIHGSKGLEWPVVFVPGLSEGILPAKFAIDAGGDEAQNEERRCFYVATTRAKSLLYISSYTEACGKWGRGPIENVSRFIDDPLVRRKLTNRQKILTDKKSFHSFCEKIECKKPSDKDIDFESYKDFYNSQLEAFLSGSRLAMKAFPVKETGFSKASLQLSKKEIGYPCQSRPKNYYQNVLKPSVAQNFQRESIKNTIGATFAPNNGASKITKIKNNKAPPYIPSRKVPARFLKLKKQEH